MGLKKKIVGCALRTRDQKVEELEVIQDEIANSITGVQTDSLVFMPTTSTRKA